MISGTAFEAYLASKKIDSVAFRSAEPELWESWKEEFEAMHPNSFTVQKLNLINPVRRKYHLGQVPVVKSAEPGAQATGPQPPSQPAAKPAKPVVKPRPKMG